MLTYNLSLAQSITNSVNVFRHNKTRKMCHKKRQLLSSLILNLGLCINLFPCSSYVCIYAYSCNLTITVYSE